MKVTVAKHAGFCKGVQDAIDKALELAKKHGKIYTLGNLVHNENVVDFLQTNGVFSVDPEKSLELLKNGDVALIRAHGIDKELEKSLKAKGVIVHDATCPVVKKIHKIVTEESEKGNYIVIVGDKNHDEVVGTFSYAGDNAKIIDETDAIEIGENPVSFVFQTTVKADNFEKINNFLDNLQKNCQKTFGIFDTICYTTKHRQEEAYTLACENDAVLVLGSRTSANTKRLFEVASAVNKNTFFASTADEAVNLLRNKQLYSISIVAGASTPPWLIQEVTKLMSETELKKDTAIAEDTKVKEAATLSEQQAEEKELTMEDVIKSNSAMGFVNVKVGKRIKGQIISVSEDGIYVGGFGGKKDGFIDKENVEIDGSYDASKYNVGDAIEATIIDSGKEFIKLSKKEVDARLAEDAEAEKALAAGDFDITLTEVTKGGLRGHLGAYTVFVPASQLKRGYVQNLEDFKGKKLKVCVMPPKDEEVEEDKPAKKSRYIFASAKMVLEREKKEKEDAFWNSIHVHDIVRGKVKRFTAFGAFVSVNGHDCLAHISELSWNKITDASTVLTIGEEYDFVVLKADREGDRISLGYKQLQKKPYEAAAEKYPVGTVIKGTVERIFSYGAFISIDDGVDGLVHVSQLSHNWIKDANEILKVGEEVEAKIIGFEDNRITLSIKELLPAPEVAPVEEATEDSEEKASKKSSRVKKFEEKVAEGEKKERRPKKDAAKEEPKEWVSGNSVSTLGDLFKGLNLQLDEEVEEKPAKKSSKKKAADAE